MEFKLQRTEKLFYRQQEQQLFSRATTDIRVRAIRDFRDEVHGVTKRATEIGHEAAVDLAPHGATGDLKRSIGSSVDPVFGPGGAGGGGSWQARLYVDTFKAPYAAYLLQGTGIYGEKRRPIEYGKVVSFFWFKAGIWWHTDQILGTPVDREWWDQAHQRMEEHLRRGLDEIHVRGVENANP